MITLESRSCETVLFQENDRNEKEARMLLFIAKRVTNDNSYSIRLDRADLRTIKLVLLHWLSTPIGKPYGIWKTGFNPIREIGWIHKREDDEIIINLMYIIINILNKANIEYFRLNW